MNDDALDLAAAKAGDELAFARLFDRHAPVVLSLCRRNTGRALADAEDAMQETFIRAHRKLDDARDAGRLRAWLYAIARHVCSEGRRAATRRVRHERRAMMLASAGGPAGITAAPEAVERDEQLARLGRALDTLDERERLAVHLHYLEPDPVAAAHDALGLSRSGYYKLLARAREHLRDRMQETEPS